MDNEIIYDQDLETILENPNLTQGYITQVTKQIHEDAVAAQDEVGHYEVVRYYPETGGKDVEWVIDTPKVAAIEEKNYEKVYQVYIPYSEDELKSKEKEEQVQQYKNMLADTDYQAIKYAEGMMTESEYIAIKADREMWRCYVRQLTEIDYSSDYTPEQIRDNIIQEYLDRINAEVAGNEDLSTEGNSI